MEKEGASQLAMWQKSQKCNNDPVPTDDSEFAYSTSDY